jgi:hypothetical protein
VEIIQDSLHYRILNILTNVWEFESRLLPQVFNTLRIIQDGLDNAGLPTDQNLEFH